MLRPAQSTVDSRSALRCAVECAVNVIASPISQVGLEDSFEIIADSDDILRTPVVGDMMKQRVAALPTARPVGGGAAVTEAEEDIREQFISPIVAPKVPARFYFKFGRPISTAGRQEELEGKEAAQALYDEIKGEVEGGIEYLVRKREEDPYKESGWRLLFEQAWGGRKAPTFRP